MTIQEWKERLDNGGVSGSDCFDMIKDWANSINYNLYPNEEVKKISLKEEIEELLLKEETIEAYDCYLESMIGVDDILNFEEFLKAN